MTKQDLRNIIFYTNTKAGKVFDSFIQILIILSLVSFSIETLPRINQNVSSVLRYFEYFSVIIFSLEYFLRVLLSVKKLKYIFSFYGIIDLFAILPFYLSTTMDLRSIRVFRLLRLIRALKLFRDAKAIRTFRIALNNVKEELLMFSSVALFTIYVSAVGIYYCESELQPEQFGSIFHCLWWAVVTLTSVGYGDVYPLTLAGKIFTSFIAIIGVAILAIPTGLMASAITRVTSDEKN